MNRSEQATLNFYEYDVNLRGYYVFDTAIDIEPPFVPFRHQYKKDVCIDDGKVPSLLSRITSIFKEDIKEEQVEITSLPVPLNPQPKLKGFSISFKQGQEISAVNMAEFLHSLYITETLSFEVIADTKTITFQIMCDVKDELLVRSHFIAFFPSVYIQEINYFDLPFDLSQDVAIADFGLENETILSIKQTDNFNIDPLTSFIAFIDNLQTNDNVVFQIILKPCTSPWATPMLTMASDGAGGDFFPQSGILNYAQEKTSASLFSVVYRIAVQGNHIERSDYLAQQLTQSIAQISSSQENKLIPLSNKGYDYQDHLRNVYFRRSNRLGIIQNINELLTFFHYPNKSIVSEKLHPSLGKTKCLPKECMGQKYVLGENVHNGEIQSVSLSQEMLSKHCVIAGGTGTGKTYFLKQLLQQFLENKEATIVIDPHADLCTDILETIAEKDKDRVVYINLADENFSFGLNIFNAETEAEKNVLSSDLASAFYETFISSGDRIVAVLQKTISTFVYSDKDVSLLDMKRFLLEKYFRNEIVKSVDDPLLQYYFTNEFPLIRTTELRPLLTRIDNFVQTRLLRNIFAQHKGIDFKELIEQKKFVLINLNVGTIGRENSKFYAKLLISKINQVAFSRLSVPKEQRHPIRLVIDEAEQFANNSQTILDILNGARKTGLSLIQVVQFLEQFSTQTLQSVLSNSSSQIYFRLNDKDAKRVASTFSFFEAEDFLELDTGEALAKVNKRSNDFNLKIVSKEKARTSLPIKEYVVSNSQRKYAVPVSEVESILQSFIPKTKEQNNKTKERQKIKQEEIVKEETAPTISFPKEIKEDEKQKFLEQEERTLANSEHRQLQDYIKKIGQSRNFVSTIEKETSSGGRIDVALENGTKKIAVEISVTNTAEYEVQNIQKCLDDNYAPVIMVSNNQKHLLKIKKRAQATVTKKQFANILFLSSKEVHSIIDTYTIKPKLKEEIINGIRVTTEFDNNGKFDAENIKKSITKMLFNKK